MPDPHQPKDANLQDRIHEEIQRGKTTYMGHVEPL